MIMLRRLQEKVGDPNVVRVYLTTFGLGVAYGMAISVIAVYLDQRGFSKSDIGSLAAWFAGGIVAVSLPSGALIARFSAKRVLVIALLTYAVTVTLFPFAGSYAAIAALRFLDGAASVCVWVASETILLARAERKKKAYVTSLYAMAIAIGYISGPLLARGAIAIMPMALAFLLAGGIASLAATYASLRLDTDADRSVHEAAGAAAGAGAASGVAPGGAEARLTTATLLGRIKTSCFATFAYGYFQSSVVLFLPLFLIHEKHVAAERTIVIPAFFAGGMLLFTNVAGRLGDRYGHLRVMRLLAVVGTTMIGGFVWLDSYAAMGAAVFVAGASLASISPLSLALQGLVTREYGRATSLYNAFYAAGMLLGPLASSRIFDAKGGGPMLYHLAALWASFIVFSVLFRHDDPATRRSVPKATIAPETFTPT